VVGAMGTVTPIRKASGLKSHYCSDCGKLVGSFGGVDIILNSEKFPAVLVEVTLTVKCSCGSRWEIRGKVNS
jgi:hypothetical protein